MASSSNVPDRDQDMEWDIATQLLRLSNGPIIAHSPAAAAAAARVAAPKVSTKVADDVRSNEGKPCLSKSLNIAAMKEAMKLFKKPDMIRTCPRCKSTNTKFCYFNNYSENQPRHECRKCKRTWTEGGAIRDVPEGSRRRRIRNKKPSNHARAINQHVLPSSAEENEAMATLESELELSLSIPPVRNTKEQKYSTNLVSLGSDDNKEGKSCLSSAVGSDSSENSMPEKVASNFLRYGTGMKEPPPHTQSNPAGPALVYPFTGSNSAAIKGSAQFQSYGTLMENRVANLLSLLPPLVPRQGMVYPFTRSNSAAITAPAITAPAPAVPFPQVSLFGNCTPSRPNGAWRLWPGSRGNTLPSLPPNSFVGSGSGSLTLGKHPREANSLEEEEAEEMFWVPKTLRVTDPEEAAKSTIWGSLGIKPDGRIFRKCSH